MPMIDYKCNECGKEFFEIVSSSDEKVQCPSCKSMNTKRIYKGKFYGKGGVLPVNRTVKNNKIFAVS